MRIELTMDLISPTTGFEDQEHHQAPSTPIKTVVDRYRINYYSISSVLRQGSTLENILVRRTGGKDKM